MSEVIPLAEVNCILPYSWMDNRTWSLYFTPVSSVAPVHDSDDTLETALVFWLNSVRVACRPVPTCEGKCLSPFIPLQYINNCHGGCRKGNSNFPLLVLKALQHSCVDSCKVHHTGSYRCCRPSTAFEHISSCLAHQANGSRPRPRLRKWG